MSADRPAEYEIQHIIPRLHAEFDGKIPPSEKGDLRERENNFLSRSLAAFTIMRLVGCSAVEAAGSLVDGGMDGGIDAALHTPTSNTLWLVQSKFFETGRGEPDLGDVSKFRDGVTDLLQGNWAAFQKNPAWVRKLPDIQRLFRDPSLRVRAVLVYSGMHTVSDGRLALFEQLELRHNQDDDYLLFSTYNLVSIHAWLTGAEDAPGVDQVELDIHQPGLVTTPYKTIYGRVRLADVAALYETHLAKLVDANLRRFKGLTAVNNRIRETLTAEPEHFFYLNNGLTAYCRQFDVAALDRANTEKKKITAREFSIVNGAQTLGTIHATKEEVGDGFVFLKVISLEKCENETEFARRITESTNFQNQISPRDFAALDEQHDRIAGQLRLDGIHYHFKEADDVPESDDANFTLEDAATALACLESQSDCGLCAMLLSNRKAVWSGDLVYPKDNPSSTLCQRLFRPERSARAVWRVVQVRQIVINQLKAQRPAQGVLRDFYENARWLVLHLLLLREKLELGASIHLTNIERQRATEQSLEIANAIWVAAQVAGFVSSAEPYTATRHFKSVFCSAEDCKRLKAGALQRLSQQAFQPLAGTSAEGTGS